MELTAGTRLGSYEIVCALGAGGMGEVYRARDTKLGRDVAIKFLSETFVDDPERVARFTREAQLLAALNHAHIGAIYGFEESESLRFLVLELVEGETLAARVARGALPVSEALALARQIVDALEAAHERGIVHRDLKPANIMLTADGDAKVLDFGLAKADARDSARSSSLTNSPTLTFAATQAGVILGTAAYMSPEQAKGRPADKRSDVWAFGCVLFEMMAGKRAFDGDDAPDTLAAVLRGQPDWTSLPRDLPPHIRTLIARCLEKDRKARIGDVSVARFLLDDGAALATASTTPLPRARASDRGWRRAVPWALTGALTLALISVLVVLVPSRAGVPRSALRVSADLGVDASLDTSRGANIALSPDGSTLAFVGAKGSTAQLYIRPLDQPQAAALSGTDGAASPFFSPDSRWVGFFADGKLKKISVSGGGAVTLCDAPNGRGASWGEDEAIVFLPQNGPGISLLRVRSAGGKPEPAIALADGEVTQRWPQVLRGGKAILFTSSASSGGFEDANIVVAELPAGARKIVQPGGYYGRYLDSGHLVYMHDGTLFATAFDLDLLEARGHPTPMVEGIVGGGSAVGFGTTAAGAAQFAASRTGTLAYFSGLITSDLVPMHWMDRAGKTTPLRATPSNWSNPQIAPDGQRVAMEIHDGKQWDVWTVDLARDAFSRLTSDAADDETPVWSPDGRRVAFSSRRARTGMFTTPTTFNLYSQRADGSGETQRLTESVNPTFVGSWHPSGKAIAFWEGNRQTSQNDLMILPMEGDEASGWRPGRPSPFLSNGFSALEPAFSPDGGWLAYQSNDNGRNDVYVRPYPGGGGKWQISTDGGQHAAWSRSRRELLYATLDGRIMVVSYSTDGDVFKADKPRQWSERRLVQRPRYRSFDIHPDGERLALFAASESAAPNKQDRIMLVFNFFDELRRVAPAK